MSNSLFNRMDAIIHRTMRIAGVADVANYADPAGGGISFAGCRVYVDEGVQLMGDMGESLGPRTAVGILRADVVKPKQWATLTFADGTVFTLETEISRDEGISRWVVSRE